MVDGEPTIESGWYHGARKPSSLWLWGEGFVIFRSVKMSSSGVLSRAFPCGVPKTYASVTALPAALLENILTDLWCSNEWEEVEP